MKNRHLFVVFFACLAIFAVPGRGSATDSLSPIYSLLLFDSSVTLVSGEFGSYVAEYDITSPTPTRAAAVGSTKMGVRFRLPDEDTNPGTVETYKIHVSTVANFTPSNATLVRTMTKSEIFDASDLQKHTEYIEGLTAGTTYHCKVMKETAGSSGELILWTTFDTYVGCTYESWGFDYQQAICQTQDGSRFEMTRVYESGAWEVEILYWDTGEEKTYHADKRKHSFRNLHTIDYTVYENTSTAWDYLNINEFYTSYWVSLSNCDSSYAAGYKVGTFLSKTDYGAWNPAIGDNLQEETELQYIPIPYSGDPNPCYTLDEGEVRGALYKAYNYLGAAYVHPAIASNLDLYSIEEYSHYPSP